MHAQNPESVAGIPVNYDESMTGDYKATLPDPLIFNDGKPVTTPREWTNKRRAEVLRIFEEEQFGKWPARKPKVHYELKQDRGLDGYAVRKQVTIYFSKEDHGPRADLLIYLPSDANAPVPLLLNLSFTPNNLTVRDEGILPGHRWDDESKSYVTVETPDSAAFPGLEAVVRKFLDAGFGFATVCYTDFEPDTHDAAIYGVRGLYMEDADEERGPDDWGTISAWAWSVSQIIDYFEKDDDIDAARIALTGCSRLGKTTLWAGAKDTRIAVVIPSCSGEGGAALSRRRFGETVAHLTTPSRYPYQFAPNYATHGEDMENMPMDAHMLIALIAPRPLLLSTGSTDRWSDPKGEFLAAVEAGPVYRLLGKDDLGTDVMPEAERPIYNTLGYVMHEGGHGVLPGDWNHYLEFIKRYL